MINPATLYNGLYSRGIRFFTGVPDSLLKYFCAYVADHASPGQHIVAANEGNAVALAAGHHLATGGVGVVYMQNSGLGNAVNPLTSLTDPEVYRIPVLLVVGWRGKPGIQDEPQHVKQGRITPGLLELLEIPCRFLEAWSPLEPLLDELFSILIKTNSPVVLLTRKNTFSEYKTQEPATPLSSLLRETALEELLNLSSPDDLIVATTGKTSRELFELRVRRGETPRDFLTVGSMGHTSSIALGVALGRPGQRVICLDGDGSLLMHLGTLPTIGATAPANLVHVLLNNGAYESVGGQPTGADRVDFARIATACGYNYHGPADSPNAIAAAWRSMETSTGPTLLEIRLRCGSRADLGRPATTAEQNKQAFMKSGKEHSQEYDS